MSERRWVALVLATLSVAFAAFASLFVWHLTNSWFGDVEFSGWSLPFGSRMLAGQRPYADFTLPIPPGSFALLELIERVRGRPLLHSELALDAACHLAMALIAYAATARITTRTNALCTALVTLVVIVQLNKECAYDHTAQVCAWLGVATGVHGLFADGARRRRLLFAAGVVAALTHLFKQSTGVGAFAGWFVAFAYLGVVAWRSDRTAPRGVVRDALVVGAGMTLGAGLVALSIVALHGSLVGFVRGVYLDGPALKGGAPHLASVLFRYVTGLPVQPAGIVSLLFVVWLLRRVLIGGPGAHLGDEPDRAVPLRPRVALLLALSGVACFGGAALLLLSPSAQRLPESLVSALGQTRVLVSLGFPIGVACFFAQLAPTEELEPVLRQRGHVLNALALLVLTTSLLHNTSAPELRLYYDNTPVVFVSAALLFIGLDRARLAWQKPIVVVACLAGLYSGKLDRALEARDPAPDGYFAGLSVGPHTRVMLDVAARVEQLTAATDRVLVLPEDLCLATLIRRPRPALAGGVVFVDQYPERMLAHDLDVLDREPPAVLVFHPRESEIWRQFYRIWSGTSPAERLQNHVEQGLAARYRFDRRYATNFLSSPTTLEIWVRRDLPSR